MNDQTFDWRTLFSTGESPYFAMFRCGCMGISLKDCIKVCEAKSIPLREKDVTSWKDGDWRYRMKESKSVLNPLIRPENMRSVPVMQSTLQDFNKWPTGWTGTTQRWFPCDERNMPLQKWGYTPDYSPTLYEREVAKALSPIGWVGQNLYAQPFIVIDIDGVGHGKRDEQVIEFGRRYSERTETWENPRKAGSFHLYFQTDRRIPISHFPFAKLDLMGNDKNAAVYTKDKVPNGLPMMTLDERVWTDLKDYLSKRLLQREERQ